MKAHSYNIFVWFKETKLPGLLLQREAKGLQRYLSMGQTGWWGIRELLETWVLCPRGQNS